MTVPLSAESPRRAGAREFGRHLATALAKRRMPKRELAREAGVTRSAIRNYLAGLNLPTFQTAERIAEALDWPGLMEVLARTREYVCPIDKRRFVFNGQSRRTYCSPECQHVAEKQRSGRKTRQAADGAIRRLQLVQGAVDAMCRSCEPEGRCRTGDCPLRAVSPLPLVMAVAS